MSDDDDRSDIGVIGFTSHNARVVQIKRMCVTPPHGAVLLRLAVEGSQGEVLVSFTRNDCVKDNGRSIPESISLELEQHAQTVQTEVYAILAWCRANGTTITTKRLRARPRASEAVARIPGLTLEESAAIIGDGDSRAIVSGVLRSNEIYMRSHLQSHHSVLQEQRELVQLGNEQAKMAGAMCMDMYARQSQLMEQNYRFQSENIRLLAENEQLKRRVAELEGVSEVAEASAEAEARAELIRNVGEAAKTAAPEAWNLFKLWMVSQAQAQAAGARSSGAVNGSSGHAGAAE